MRISGRIDNRQLEWGRMNPVTAASRLLQWCLAACLLVMAATIMPAHATGDVAASQEHLRAAHAAYGDGDYERFVASLETAYSLNPGSYYTRYNLACAYALTGRTDAALELLDQLTRARVDFGMADDEDLASLRDLPRFRALADQLAATTTPTNSSRRRFTVDELGLIPEGIAYDGESGRLFFGSMRTGEIFVADRQNQLARFARVEKDAPLAAIGMTVDNERGVLWVVGTQFFMTEDFDKTAPTWSGLFGFDLQSGELRRRYLRDDVENGYNDVTLGPDGQLYLSGGTIGVVADGDDRISDVNVDREVFGSNGIVATPDGEWLITSSYPVGIAAVRLDDGEVHFLAAPDDVPLYGIDGMYWHDGALIAVQNGVQPWRIMRFELNDELTAITAATTLDFANADSTATTAVIVGDALLHVGQGPEPEHPPAHFADALRPFLGKTVIMTAPLD